MAKFDGIERGGDFMPGGVELARMEQQQKFRPAPVLQCFVPTIHKDRMIGWPHIDPVLEDAVQPVE